MLHDAARSIASRHAAQQALADVTDDDLIALIDDDEREEGTKAADTVWRILIADDDASVHDATIAALSGLRLHDRALAFSHTYSAAETVELLEASAEIDLVLLDVVMESPDAGLRAVQQIRGRLNRPELKIIIRTGQPGHAPEEEIRRNYSIDGYARKAELTRSMLRDVIARALMSSPDSGGAH